ncbi:MAG: hypothetical protein HY830_04145 [Actinobacteria bacterium]|nr:hypothetical protein [Actinomycetota bacterium]
MEPTGVPARELSDEELERQGTHAHATRNWVFLHGTAEQFAHHTERMLELEKEYLRRHPKRTWQGSADSGGEVDEATRLRTALRGLVTQIESVLAEADTLPGNGSTAGPGAAAGRQDGGAGVTALLTEVAAAPGGRLHRLELHQAARRAGLPRADLAQLYRSDPPLLAADGADRVLTEAGKEWLAARA